MNAVTPYTSSITPTNHSGLFITSKPENHSLVQIASVNNSETQRLNLKKAHDLAFRYYSPKTCEKAKRRADNAASAFYYQPGSYPNNKAAYNELKRVLNSPDCKRLKQGSD